MTNELLRSRALFAFSLLLVTGCTSNESEGGGTAGTATGGKASGGSGAGGGTTWVHGEILELVPGIGDVPYAIGDNPYGIRGGGFLARSAHGNTITVGNDEGKICIEGSLE